MFLRNTTSTTPQIRPSVRGIQETSGLNTKTIFNTLRPRQNDRYLLMIFSNAYTRMNIICFDLYLAVVCPYGSNDMSSGNKPLPEPMLTEIIVAPCDVKMRMEYNGNYPSWSYMDTTEYNKAYLGIQEPYIKHQLFIISMEPRKLLLATVTPLQSTADGIFALLATSTI